MLKNVFMDASSLASHSISRNAVYISSSLIFSMPPGVVAISMTPNLKSGG
jgi:hypothetical protein